MSVFLTKIHVNKVFHLENFDIELDPNEKKHLILTGKNGSGKTSLLNGLADFLQVVKNDKTLSFLRFSRDINKRKTLIRENKSSSVQTIEERKCLFF